MDLGIVAVYHVLGISDVVGSDRLNLVSTSAASAYLASEPEEALLMLRRRNALGVMLGSSLMGQTTGATPRERFDAALASPGSKIRKPEDGMLLVVECSQRISGPNIKIALDLGEFALALASIDEQLLLEQANAIRDAALAGISLSLPDYATHGSRQLGYAAFVIEEGTARRIINVTPTISAIVSSLQPLEPEPAELAVRYAEAISASSRKLQNVPRLLAQSLDDRNDALRSFVAAWTGLEVLVAVTFSTYEAMFLESFRGALPAAASSAIERIREVMGTRYRLLDRFVIMASSLDPEGCAPDIAQFERVKRERDRFVHTMSGEPADLPTGTVQSLLRKYLRLHLEASSGRRH
jgi:hypothetical protein